VISVIIPCYNEIEVLQPLFERLTMAAASWNRPYEVLVVDDGSREPTWKLLQSIHERDPRWRVVRFARNFGHQTAVSAGLFYARGDAVIILDADLQDPPEELQRFIDKWQEGNEVVYAIRTQRKEGLLKRTLYALFYRMLGWLSDVRIPYDSGDFCLLDRKIVDLINAMPEQNRFVRGMRAWVGFRQVGVTYARAARAGGEPQYTLAKLIKLAVDGIFSFSTTPLRIVTYLGLIISSLSFFATFFTLLQRMFAPTFAQYGLGPVPGFATIVMSVLFLGGIQLVCLGVIGEYVGRIYDEVKRRPLWVVREMLDAESDTASLASEHRIGRNWKAE
jgi:polyisoprenyl-phosphate glycosyltransferase